MPILSMFLDTIMVAVVLGYLYHEHTEDIVFKGVSSNRLWGEALIIGVIAGCIILLLSTKFTFINIS